MSAGMNEEEILGQALLFVFAGYDTTATTLGFLIHSLTLNQDIQQRLYDEIESQLGDEVCEALYKLYQGWSDQNCIYWR